MCTNVEITIKITTGLHYHDCICTVSEESMKNILLEIDFFLTNQAHQSG